MNAQQVELLKPTQKNVMMGSILKDAAGKGAVRLIAKRRIDMIDGSDGSCSCLLNSTGQMEIIREVNAFVVAVAVICKDKVDEKARAKESTDQKPLKRAEKQNAAESAEEAHQNEVMPFLMEMMGRFETGDNFDGVKALSATVLKDILKFYFNITRLKGVLTMKKADLVIEVTNQLIASRDRPPLSL